MAKRVGLTRPLAYLTVRDQLVYKALVALAENDLIRSSPKWGRLGRAQETDDDSITLSSSGWFRAWLKRDGQIWVMNSSCEWLVESDISNFFPSVSISDVVAFVSDNSRLGIDLVRLLEYMLQTFSPLAGYHPLKVGGLPQEGFDVSRVLAHVYLKPLDEEFRAEGEADRYTRWVDDIVAGADTWDEALKMVRRLQATLESLGLYPNSAKTRVIRRAAFRLDYMKAENDDLGVIEEQIKAGTADRLAFRAALVAHLHRRDHPKGWPRVLRRFYTLSRGLRDEYLVERWQTHIEETPDSARNVFDYLSTFRITQRRFRRLLEVLDRFGTVYEDIEILAHEYVCAAPAPGSGSLPVEIAEWALRIVEREAVARPRIAAAACTTVGKFGDETQLRRLLAAYRGWSRDSVVRTQALVVLLGAGLLGSAELQNLLARSRLESLENIEFLIALCAGEKQATGMAFSALQPIKRHQPDRYVVRPRMLFLAPLVATAAPREWRTQSAKWHRQLTSNTRELRDHASERWLFSVAR